jgi:hypothetical protein
MKGVDAAELLIKYTEKGYNILTTSITPDDLMDLIEGYRARVVRTMISADPDFGDVWTADSKKYALHKQAIDRLSLMANVLWHDGGGSARVDKEDNTDYCQFRAFAAIRHPDGSKAPGMANFSTDLVAIEDDLRHLYRERGSKPGKWQKTGVELDEYVNHCTTRDMRKKRNFIVELTESGARNRVNMWLLGLHRSYTKKQLTMPFVVVKVAYHLDFTNPDTRRLADEEAMGARTRLFGPVDPPQITHQPPENVVDVKPDEDTLPPDMNGDGPPNGSPPGADGPPSDVTSDFALWDRASQIKHIRAVSLRKNYGFGDLITRMKNVTAVEDLSDTQIVEIYEHINQRPDVVTDNIDDDIPF